MPAYYVLKVCFLADIRIPVLNYDGMTLGIIKLRSFQGICTFFNDNQYVVTHSVESMGCI